MVMIKNVRLERLCNIILVKLSRSSQGDISANSGTTVVWNSMLRSLMLYIRSRSEKKGTNDHSDKKDASQSLPMCHSLESLFR